MKVVRIDDLKGTEREVISPAGWTSMRFLLKSDGMGFSFHETTFPAGLKFDMWYKNHVEAVFCYSGKGILTNRETGETFDIKPGTVYALDKYDKHTLEAIEELKLVCAFNPPVSGSETHDEEGAYIADTD